MTRTNSLKLNTATFALVIFALLAVVGCSNNPIANDPQTAEPQVLSRVGRTVGTASASPINLYTEQVISASEGGTLTLLDVVLDIPAGAVPQDTVFSIMIPDDEIFYNEFGTDGLKFDKPVTVTMSYRNADLSGIKESTIRIGYLNESTGVWQDMVCTLDRVNKTVTAELYHFSAYGLISD